MRLFQFSCILYHVYITKNGTLLCDVTMKLILQEKVGNHYINYSMNGDKMSYEFYTLDINGQTEGPKFRKYTCKYNYKIKNSEIRIKRQITKKCSVNCYIFFSHISIDEMKTKIWSHFWAKAIIDVLNHLISLIMINWPGNYSRHNNPNSVFFSFW